MDYILTSNGELYHYGVKGMKWGVRKKYDTPNPTKGQRKWEKDVRKNWSKAYNRASMKVNSRIKDFNDEWERKGTDFKNTNSDSYKKYVRAYCDMWNNIYTDELYSTFGRAPIDTGREWCETVWGFMDPDDF